MDFILLELQANSKGMNLILAQTLHCVRCYTDFSLFYRVFLEAQRLRFATVKMPRSAAGFIFEGMAYGSQECGY